MTFLGNTNKGFVITCRDPCDTRAFSHSLSLSVVFLFFEDRHESHDHCDEDITTRFNFVKTRSASKYIVTWINLLEIFRFPSFNR